MANQPSSNDWLKKLWPSRESLYGTADRTKFYNEIKGQFGSTNFIRQPFEVSNFLYSEARAELDQCRAIVRNLESKAATQLGILGTGLGLASLFGSQFLSVLSSHVVDAGLILLALSVALNALALWPIHYKFPRIDGYNYPATLGDGLLVGVQHQMTDDLMEVQYGITVLSVRKARAHEAATVCFVFGVAVLVLGALLSAKQNSTNVVGCKPTAQRITCTEKAVNSYDR
jgi:hypothetical protein